MVKFFKRLSHRRPYHYGNPVDTKEHKKSRRIFVITLLVTIVALLGLLAIFYELGYDNPDAPTPTSRTNIKKIAFEGNIVKNSYFSFSDTGNWQHAEKESTSNKFIYRKYLGKSEVVQHQITVYINQVPIALDLAVPRVLPVSILNGNSFEVKKVSGPCGETYGRQELHKIKLAQLSGTSLLCDPDSPQYKVLIGQIGGDYNLKLKRADGSVANYIIIYQNQKVNPDEDTISQIARSFHAL